MENEERLKVALGDRYQVQRELGSGGMATVYLAQDLKHDRKVAVKVLKPELAAVLGAERFLSEIKTTANLQHPHILPLHDSGEADGFLFYVMPYVEGESLRAKLDRDGQLPIDEALRLGGQVAEALSSAHRTGVVHRDIKPENILLREGQAIVADFGVALAVGVAGSARLTATGISLGTPTYMSPEQVTGDSSIDARSDIYSLGCVLYEMLAGAPPFTGANAQAVLAKHLTDPVPPMTTVRPGLPQPVARAIVKALGKAPADRFESATKFSRALFSSPEIEAGAIAVLPFANLSPDPDDEFLSDGIAEEIINALANVPGLRVIARTSSFAFKGKNQDVRAIGSRLGVGRVLEGSVRRAGSRLRITAQLINAEDGEHVWSERYDRGSEDVFEIQDDIAASISEKLRCADVPDEASQTRRISSSQKAYELYLRGRYHLSKMTDKGLNQAISCFEEACELDGIFARAFAGIAEALVKLCLGPGVLVPGDVMAKAKGAAERALGIDPTSAEGHTWLGAVEMHYGWDWDAAGRRFRQAISLSPNLAEAYSWYAWYLTWVEDRYDEALEAYEEAERLDPLALEIKHLRAYTHYAAGKLDLALESFRGLLEIEEGYAQAYYGIGDVYNQQGRLDDAILEFEKSLELGGRATNAVALLAYLYGLAGRPEEAWPLINELEERASRGYVSELWTAIAYAGMGEADKMFDYLERGYRGRDPAMVYLSRTHEFDAYRSDPRFRTLLEKMGLERFDL